MEGREILVCECSMGEGMERKGNQKFLESCSLVLCCIRFDKEICDLELELWCDLRDRHLYGRLVPKKSWEERLEQVELGLFQLLFGFCVRKRHLFLSM